MYTYHLRLAVAHLRVAYMLSKEEADPVRYEEFRKVLENVNLTLGVAIQWLEEMQVEKPQPTKKAVPNTAAFFDNEGEFLETEKENET